MAEERSRRPTPLDPTSPELAGFVAALRADPDDDATRLVLADWLDEHGHEEQARFVRLNGGPGSRAAASQGRSTPPPEGDGDNRRGDRSDRLEGEQDGPPAEVAEKLKQQSKILFERAQGEASANFFTLAVHTS